LDWFDVLGIGVGDWVYAGCFIFMFFGGRSGRGGFCVGLDALLRLTHLTGLGWVSGQDLM
jgi:hypothetical protein